MLNYNAENFMAFSLFVNNLNTESQGVANKLWYANFVLSFCVGWLFEGKLKFSREFHFINFPSHLYDDESQFE